MAVGIWGTDSYWTDFKQGHKPTHAWVPGAKAIFSAGDDASGTFTVGVSGNQIASGISFEEGTITLTNGTITLTTGAGNATIGVDSGLTATIASQLAGNSGLIKAGAGTLILSGVNSYSGITDLREGLLLIANNFALGNSTLNLNGGIVGAAFGGRSVGNALTVSANSTIGGSYGLTFSGNVSVSGSRTLTINNSAATTFSGATFSLPASSGTLTLNTSGGNVAIGNTIVNGSGNSSLNKTGTGELTLTGNNTFSGGLNISAGALRLGSDRAAGTGTLSLGNGTTLAGAGGDRIITNNLAINGDVTFAGSNLTLTDSFDLNSNRTFTVQNTLVVSGAVSGTNRSLTKNGDGTLVLTGNNTFGGTTNTLTVNAGTLAIGHNNAIGNPNTSLLLNGGTVTAYGAARIVPNPFILSKDSTIGGSENLTFSGTALNRGGTNMLTVNNTGVTTFSGPTFALSNPNAAGAVNLNVAGTSGGVVINNVIEDSGPGSPDSFIKSGAGTLTLGGGSPNTFSGGLILNAGTLNAAKANALGSGNLTLNSGTLNIGANNQTVGAVTMASGTINGTSGQLTGSSYQIQSGTVNATLAGSAALTKTTSGTLALNRATTYTGGTTINGGTVLVNNTTGSGTGTGAVVVNNTGTLGGTGSISGLLTLNSGSTLSPGTTTPGTFTAGASIWNSGATLSLGVSDADAGAGVGWDVVNLNGLLTVNGSSASPIFVDIHSLNLDGTAGLVHDFDSTQDYSWRILSAAGGISFNAGEDASTAFSLVYDRFQNDLAQGQFTLAMENNDLVLHFAPIPEPSTGALLAIGFALFFAWSHFRRNSKPTHAK